MHGDAAVIRDAAPARRYIDVIRPSGLPSPVSSPYHAGLFPLQLLVALFSMYIAIAWVGALRILVGEEYEAICAISFHQTRLPHITVCGRPSGGPLFPWYCVNPGSLRCCTQGFEKADAVAGPAETSRQRMLEWNFLEHPGMVINTEEMQIFVQGRKIRRVRELSSKLLRRVRLSRRTVSM